MYKIKNIKALEDLGFKEYKSGYSKKFKLCDGYNVLDILFDDLIVKKFKFVENKFIYEFVDKVDLYVLINKTLKLNQIDTYEFINKNFEEIEGEN